MSLGIGTRAFRLTGEAREADLALLWDHGCLGLWQDGESVLAYFPGERELPLAGVWEAPDATDYVARYHAELKPVAVGDLVVAPTHGPVTLRAGQRPLWLDPGMAFGTGHHETTRLALEALSRVDLSGLDILDVGAGSGILAVAADLLGAASARGLDIDPDTVPVAEHNARRNRSRATFALGGLQDEPDGSADLILANLFAELHVLLAPHYARVLRPGGRLLATGILAEKLEKVRGAFSGFALLAERRAGDWLLVEARVP